MRRKEVIFMTNMKTKNELQKFAEQLSEYHAFQKDAFIQNANIAKQAPCINDILKLYKMIDESHFYAFYESKDAFYKMACEKIIECMEKDKSMANAIANKYKSITQSKERISVGELKNLLKTKQIDVDACYELFGDVMDEYN